jgi:hypothetical protein
MRKLIAALTVVLLSFVLQACGGGGGSSNSGSGSPPAPNQPSAVNPNQVASVSSSQSNAEAQVATAASQSIINDIFSAGAATAIPFGASIVRLPLGATQSQTVQCAELGVSGSGSFSVTATTNDATQAPVSAAFSYNNCTFSNGAGTTVSINGSGSLQFLSFTDELNFKFAFTVNATVTATTPSGTQSATVNATQTCTVNNGADTCATTINGNQISDVSINALTNNTVTIDSATVQYNNITISYSNVVYDNSLHRMTSGTITVTDSASGNSATITATGSGYTVVVNAGGSTTTYTVAFYRFGPIKLEV